ncbi:hypothetical protein [Labrys monachus]|uniref:Uncharacterized protein n=1 Tax=Labrys monachus TaxID=217067 RepID=A0ABU0FPA0_9HYPH|nr:hypothetical protein [Labrys monachus]MDQ0395865.1 hypothetical protein [Labrys monachus]
MKYFLPLSILMLSVAGPVLASDLQLTGAEIKARIIGNTVTGVDDGDTYQEYYNPNGSIAGTDNTGKYTGNWRIDGDQLCTIFQDTDNDVVTAKDWNCSNIGVIGDHVIWNDDGDLSDAKLIPGRR